MALENPPLNGKIMKNVHLFLELFPNYVVLLLSIPAKEPPCAGEGGHFGIVGHCQTLPPLYHAFISPNGTPPLIILGPEFWLQTTKRKYCNTQNPEDSQQGESSSNYS